MTYLKIKDNKTLVRDSNTKCIVNTDVDGYTQYVETYKKVYTEKVRLNELEEQIHEIKSDISEIKMILLNLSKT